MDVQTAKQIIDEFSIVSKKTEGLAARAISLLQHSKGKIKYAFFTYIEHLIKEQQLDIDTVNELTNLYTRLDPFIDDKKAQEINRIGDLVKRNAEDLSDPNQLADRTQFDKFITDTSLGFNAMQEIMDFMHECFKENGQPSLIYQETPGSGLTNQELYIAAKQVIEDNETADIRKTQKKRSWWQHLFGK